MSAKEPESDRSATALWLLAFKRQQLQHRLGLLVKAREFSSAPPEESINTTELETIEAELEDVSKRQTELLKSGKLQKDPLDVRLFGESIFPEPDYPVPQEMIPEPDYDVPEELLPEQPSPEELSPGEPSPEEPLPEEPSSEANDIYMDEPEETEPPEIINQPVVSQEKLFRDPDWVTCSSCSGVVRTVVKHNVTGTTWILCVTLSSIGCMFGCCLVPFCVKKWKDVSHHCPNCKAKIHSVPMF